MADPNQAGRRAVSKFGIEGQGGGPRLPLRTMSFSLDLTKPLGRLGLAINAVILGAVFYGVSAGAYRYMSHTLPEAEAHHQEAVVKAALVDKAVAKAKTAAKGKVFDEKASLAEAKQVGLAAAAKEHDKIKHEAEALWSPFAVFLLIISAIFFAGFLSIALQRRVNEAGKNGLLVFVAHLGAWALATFIAFEPFLTHHGLTKAWSVGGIAGIVLMLPVVLAGAGQADDHGH